MSVIERAFLTMFSADRFGVLNHYSPFRVPKMSDTNVWVKTEAIDEILDARAKSIIESGKTIYLAFSGGADSTAIAVALVKNGVPRENLNLVYFPTARASAPDSFNFFSSIGANLIETVDLKGYPDTLSEDDLFVIGNGADILFGANCHRFNPDLYNLPWLQGLEAFLRLKGVFITKESFDVLKRVYDGYAAYIGVELEQFCEFAWLQNFGLNWSFTMEEALLDCSTQKGRDLVLNFYDTLDFQSWSVNNYGNLRKKNPFKDFCNYRSEFKKYIVDYTKEQSFLRLTKTFANTRYIRRAPEVKVRDTEGYKTFRLKDSTGGYRDLAHRVSELYLKEEFKD